MRIRIVRFAGGTNYTSAGVSAQVTPPTSVVSTFNTRLSILANDYVGLDRVNADLSGDVFHSGVSGAEFTEWSPSIADGSTASTFTYATGWELLVNADIEADADGDGYGDETQDQCSTVATTHGPCPAVLPSPQLDITPPKQNIKIKKRQRLSKLKLIDTLDEAGTVTVSTKVRKKNKTKTLGRSKVTKRSVAANVAKVLKVKFSKKTLKKLKKLMRKRNKRKLRATVTVSAVDQSGNTNTVKNLVSLKR